MPTKAEALAELARRGIKLPTAAPEPNAQDGNYLSDLRTRASQSLNTATQAERFLELNKKTPTGGMAGWPVIGGMVREARASADPNWAAMEGITGAVAPTMRPPGSGSSSDKDTGLYISGFTNTRVPYKANEQTHTRLRDAATHDAAHAAFMDSYYKKTGSLLGGEQAFADWWSKTTANGNPFSGSGGGGGTKVDLPGGGTAIVRPR